MRKQNDEKRKEHQDTRISAYPHSLEEVLEKALQVPPPDGKKRRGERSKTKPPSDEMVGTD